MTSADSTSPPTHAGQSLTIYVYIMIPRIAGNLLNCYCQDRGRFESNGHVCIARISSVPASFHTVCFRVGRDGKQLTMNVYMVVLNPINGIVTECLSGRWSSYEINDGQRNFRPKPILLPNSKAMAYCRSLGLF